MSRVMRGLQCLILMVSLVLGGTGAVRAAEPWLDIYMDSTSCDEANGRFGFSLFNDPWDADDTETFSGTYKLSTTLAEIHSAPFTIAPFERYELKDFELPMSARGVELYLDIEYEDGSTAREYPGTCGYAEVTKSGSVTVSTSDGGSLSVGTQLCFDDECSTYIEPRTTPFTHTRNNLTAGKTYTITVQGAVGYDTATTTLTMPAIDGASSASTSLIVQKSTVVQTGRVMLVLSTEDGQPLPPDAQACVDAMCIELDDLLAAGQTTLSHDFGEFTVGPHAVTVTTADPYADYTGSVTVVGSTPVTKNVVLAVPLPPNQSESIRIVSSNFSCGDDIDGVRGQFTLRNSSDTDIRGDWYISDSLTVNGQKGAEGADVTVPANGATPVGNVNLGPYFLGRPFFVHFVFDDDKNLDQELSLCGEQVEVTKSVRLALSTDDGAPIPAGTEICLDSDCGMLASAQSSPYITTWEGLEPDREYQVTISSAAPYHDRQESVRTPAIADIAGSSNVAIVLHRDALPPSGEVTVTFDTVDGKPIPPSTRVCIDDVCVVAGDVLPPNALIFSRLMGVFEPGEHTLSVSGAAPYVDFSFPFKLEPASSTGFGFTLQRPDEPEPEPTATVVPTSIPSPTATIVPTATTVPTSTPSPTATVVPSPSETPTSSGTVSPTPDVPTTTPGSDVTSLPKTGAGSVDSGTMLIAVVLLSVAVVAGVGLRKRAHI